MYINIFTERISITILTPIFFFRGSRACRHASPCCVDQHLVVRQLIGVSQTQPQVRQLNDTSNPLELEFSTPPGNHNNASFTLIGGGHNHQVPSPINKSTTVQVTTITKSNKKSTVAITTQCHKKESQMHEHQGFPQILSWMSTKLGHQRLGRRCSSRS